MIAINCDKNGICFGNQMTTKSLFLCRKLFRNSMAKHAAISIINFVVNSLLIAFIISSTAFKENVIYRCKNRFQFEDFESKFVNRICKYAI